MNGYFSLKATSRNALPDLVASQKPFEIVIAKKDERFLVFLNASRPDLEAVRLHIDPNPVTVQLNSGIVIEREIPRSLAFPLIQTKTDFSNTLNYMQNMDYVCLSLTPSISPLSLVEGLNYSHEIQIQFHGKTAYFLRLKVSDRLKDSMISDLNKTGSHFHFKENFSEVRNLRKIEENMLSVSEARTLMEGLNEAIRKLFPGDLETLFDPCMGNTMPDASYNIGFCREKAVGFDKNDVLRNICIAGISGSGKTTLMKQLVQDIHENQIPIVILAPIKDDFSRAFPECALYRHGDIKHPFLLSMTDLPHENSAASYAATALSQIVSLGDADSMLPMIFQNAFSAVFANPEEVELTDVLKAALHELNGYHGNTNFSSMQAAVINRIKTAYSVFPCTRSNIRLESLFTRNEIAVIELEGMATSERRTLAAIFLARFISFARKFFPVQEPRTLRCVLIIDELHELLREDSQNDPFKDLLISALTTLQANGVGLVLADQRMDMLGIFAENCANRIVMKHSSSEFVRKLFSLPSDSEVFDVLPFLTAGQGILLRNNHPSIPFVSKSKTNTSYSSSNPSIFKNYHPFPSCDAVCEGCNHCIRTTVYSLVLQMSYTTNYAENYHQAANDSERKKALIAAYTFCLSRLPKDSNFDMTIYRECLKHEILRRFALSYRH